MAVEVSTLIFVLLFQEFFLITNSICNSGYSCYFSAVNISFIPG